MHPYIYEDAVYRYPYVQIGGIMEGISLILSAICTVAAVISAICAVKSKNEVTKLRNSICGNNNTQISGNVHVENSGENHGIVSGVNSGEIKH